MFPVYIVSLKKDFTRRNTISKKLNEYKIGHKFVDAVVGKELSPEEISMLNLQGIKKRKRRSPTFGELGCSLSHQKIYNEMINNHIEWAIILEDDAIIDKRFADFYHKLESINLSLEPSNIYLLGGQEGLVDRNLVALSLFNNIYLGGTKFRKVIKSEQYVFRTCCYLLNKKMCEMLTSLFRDNFFIADEWKYLTEQKIIKSIYLAKIVSHPIDLGDSNIAQEREIAFNQSHLIEQNKHGWSFLVKKLLKKYLKVHVMKKNIRIIFRKLYCLYS